MLEHKPIVRFRIADIAREAGVSVATVDRVLNHRPGVRVETRERVLAVSERLGYIRAAGSVRARRAEIDIILPGGTNSYINLLADNFRSEAANRLSDAEVSIHRVEGFNPDALAKKVIDLSAVSGAIGLIALEHPAVREAIRAAVGRGVPVVTLVSDISGANRAAYVGIDNRAAGRLAGHILGRFIGPGPGKVALFAGSLSYRGHEEREMGFRHIIREEFPNLSVVAFHEVQDDRTRGYASARRTLADHPDLDGMYNAGGGTRGIVRALTESGRAGKIVFVAHEVTEQMRGFLLSGVVAAAIDQSCRLEAREALNVLIANAFGRDQRPAPIPLQVILKENIPA